ncbi:MAG: hypothetical protein ABI867_07000 [Kofleriaceae bacterium]
MGDRLVRLTRRTFKSAVLDSSAKRITLGLHPNAPPVRITVLPEGDLEIRADTTAVGPGYHADVLARIAPILEELEYVLEGDAGDPKTDMTAWLAEELRAGTRLVGMPVDRCFNVDAAVLTAMGPRDAAWRDAVLADPARGSDAFAWWQRGPGTEARSRALLAMWFDVPWREPLDADERTLMEQVDTDLTIARKANRELDLPYPEWSLLLDWIPSDEDHADRIRAKAGDREATIGYRRYPMDVEVSGGWIVELGGNFVGHWDDDGERWWATDGERVVELTSLTAPDETDSQRLLDVAPPINPVVERFAEANRRGRAEVYDEGSVHVVHGLMACAPHVAILTCKGEKSDEAWALATWRSLRNP